jgi:hypothetical protein
MLGDWDLEIFDDLSGAWVVEPVEKISYDSEGLGNDATDLSRVVALLSGLDI